MDEGQTPTAPGDAARGQLRDRPANHLSSLRAGGAARPQPRWRLAFAALDTRLFRRWFFAQVFSASGTITQVVALSWLVLKLTHSPVDLGLMGSFTFLPMLLGGPLAGVLVDRVERRRLLIVTQTLYILLAALLTALIATGSEKLWMLYAIAFATGLVTAPDNTARQVFVIELVGPDKLASAVSLYEVILNLSRVLGPAAGGVLLATVGVAPCCALNGASYIPPLIVLLAARAAGEGPQTPRERSGHGLLDGIRYARESPAMRVTILMAAASGMLFNLATSLPLMATRVFHVGGGGYGLMMAVFGIGALGGALLAAESGAEPSWTSVRKLAAATGVAVIAAALAPSLATDLAALAVTGWLSIWFIARANTFVQLATSVPLRGSVMGLWTAALPGSILITAPCVGWVASVAGARSAFAVSGVALLLLAGAGWRALSGRVAVATS